MLFSDSIWTCHCRQHLGRCICSMCVKEESLLYCPNPIPHHFKRRTVPWKYFAAYDMCVRVTTFVLLPQGKALMHYESPWIHIYLGSLQRERHDKNIVNKYASYRAGISSWIVTTRQYGLNWRGLVSACMFHTVIQPSGPIPTSFPPYNQPINFRWFLPLCPQYNTHANVLAPAWSNSYSTAPPVLLLFWGVSSEWPSSGLLWSSLQSYLR